ncbi:MAG TPA: DUF4326 domain-containing protein [Thermodesulfobacteriota bacterium]|nr:DUF4326 domain-containing protein [Thermodesulfobacteriota bacterium]
MLKLPTVVNLKHEPYDIYIGRKFKKHGLELECSIWHNPFIIGKHGNRKKVIELYREYILNTPELLERLPELEGKRLGCFCKPKMCHGDILVELFETLHIKGREI